MAYPLAAFLPALWEWGLLAWLFMLGASVGSFLNVVVYRLPRGMSLLRPASRCPACGAPIVPRDNLPIVGWLLLAGRCRACGQTISARYPMVELWVAVLFAALAWWGPFSGGRNFPVSPERVQGAGLRVPGAEGLSPPFWPPGYTPPMSPAELWGVYAYHVGLLCCLIAAGLTEYDGQRFSRRLGLLALTVGLAAPLLWPVLRPVGSGLVAEARHAPRLAALADGTVGLAAGWMLGWAASALGERSHRRALLAPTAAGTRFAAALGWAGVFLGWQAAAALAVAATATNVCTSLAARRASALRRVGPVLCLALWTPVWILSWRAIVDHAPWFGAAANGWIFAGTLAAATALGWLAGKTRHE